MKILVDEMPKLNIDCPYCKDNSNYYYEEYKCTWNNVNHYCDIDNCPYFTDKGGVNNETI